MPFTIVAPVFVLAYGKVLPFNGDGELAGDEGKDFAGKAFFASPGALV
jgi:hypothetical protein